MQPPVLVTKSDLWRHLMFRWVMTIVKPNKGNHMFVCLPLLAWLAGASCCCHWWGLVLLVSWNIGDCHADSDSFMVAPTHSATQGISSSAKRYGSRKNDNPQGCKVNFFYNRTWIAPPCSCHTCWLYKLHEKRAKAKSEHFHTCSVTINNR